MRFFYLPVIAFLCLCSFGQVELNETNLVLILIDTYGQAIVDEPKTEASMKIIYNGDGSMNSPDDIPNMYDGNAGIELRGRYSQLLPQKSYGFETYDMAGEEINVPLLGFPEENDWILLANYNDKSFVRNTFIFHLFRKMGRYAPRALHCEVILNDEYQGIYVFTEKIKRDKNRVNIPKLDSDDNAGDSLTGGYIFKTDYSEGDDYWVSNYTPGGFWEGSVRFIYNYPGAEEITAEQRNYLSYHVNEFEDVLFGDGYKDVTSGYRAYIDVNSFVDYFIIGEVTRNVDAYKKSCYYYKQSDSKGGLIYAGPVWDFDWAMKNFDECIYRNTDGSGWAYEIHECTDPRPNPVPPAWILRLLSDSYFANKICSRYFNLRNTILSEDYIFNYIDSVVDVIYDAQERHYDLWQILGENAGTPEVDEIPETFEGEIEKLKNWFSLRLDWLDVNMVGEQSNINDHEDVTGKRPMVIIYPNPADEYTHIRSNAAIKEAVILGMDGKFISHMKTDKVFSTRLFTGDLLPGFYLIKTITVDNKVYINKFVKK